MRSETTTRLAEFGARARVAAFELPTLDWWDRMFGVDLIVSSLALHHLNDAKKQYLYKAAAERLSPRGALLIADLIEPQHPSTRDAAADRWDALARQQAESMGAPALLPAVSRRALESLPLSRCGRSAGGADASPGVAAPCGVRRGGLLSGWMPGTPSSAASSRLQRQHRDLRRTVDPHRHVDRSDAAAHEHRRLLAPGEARRPPETSAPRRRRPAAARPGRRACARRARAARRAPPPSASRRGSCASRIGRRRRAAHERGDVGRPLGPEADADEIDRLLADRQARPRVLQDLDAVPGERERHVVIVVVVAEDGEDAVRRRERRRAPPPTAPRTADRPR